jgi:MFS family permease
MRFTSDQTRRVVAALGVAQTIAWASTYYLPAILANSIARDLGISSVMVFAAFSVAMITSAMLAPLSGRFIDAHGGRGVLLFSNALFVAGLVLLSMAKETTTLFLAWLVLGLGMGTGLYEAAFATLARIYGRSSRGVITGITLIAGFASTVGWPVTALLEAQYGWRMACLVWASLHILIALPLNFMLPGKAAVLATVPNDGPVEGSDTAEAAVSPAPSPPRYLVPLLAFVFAVGWFNSTSMGTHLPRLLEAAGAAPAVAIAAGALIGPAQVAARIFEYSFMQGYHPLVAARIATLTHPVGAVLLMLVGGPAAYVFTIFHGTGNGIMTISKGTLPLMLFGPANYGYLQGIISAPGRILQAFAPILFGFALETLGASAIWLTTGLSLMAFLALMVLKIDVAKQVMKP